MRPDGSGGRDVVTRPGHYVEPSFSPDGKSSSIATPAATRFAGPYYAEDAGIYVVPAAGGTPLLARESGSDPEFDHTGTRIYVREVRNEKYTLLSVGVPTAASPLPGRDEIEHVRSDNATQIVPSPDGKWVAFEERFRTYVAAFPRTGRPVDVGPATADVSRAARVARRRFLPALVGRQPPSALGARPRALHPRALDELVRVRRRRQAKAAEPEAKGVPIGFTAKGDMPTGVDRARRRARHHDGEPGAAGPIQGTPGVIENATIHRRGQSHHRRRSVVFGDGARRRDADRRQGQDDHARHHRRPRASRRRVERPHRANELAACRQPRVRRDDVARSVERQRDRVHQRRAGARRAPSSVRACSRPGRSSTAPRRRSRPWSKTTTMRCRTSGGRRRSGAISVKSYNQQRRDARQMIVKASRELEHARRARRRIAPLHEPDA